MNKVPEALLAPKVPLHAVFEAVTGQILADIDTLSANDGTALSDIFDDAIKKRLTAHFAS